MSAKAEKDVAMRIILPDAHRRMPWKNGAGTTTEIAIDPPGADVAGRFRWRLSIADVERSGPFSAFPGYERTIMVIEGGGMELAVGQRPAQRLDRLFVPFVFSGDTPAECRLLEGPIRDFNLMVERSSARSHLEVLHLGDAPRRCDMLRGDLIIHCFDGGVDFAMPAGALAGALPADGTVIITNAGRAHQVLQLSAAGGRATVAIIEMTPVVATLPSPTLG
jgi:environmental stress-induced protein Ves